MAARKKAKKSKAKKAKKTKRATRGRRTAKKSAVRKRVGAGRKKAQARARTKRRAQGATRKPAAKRPAPATDRSAPAPEPAAASGERIGVVIEYHPHLAMATVQLENGRLRVGEMVRIKGNGGEFTQTVGWLEVDHVHVDEVHAGQTFGLRLSQHARAQDVVYKVLQ
ncbi:MAG TPA: hypothetical protein VIL43_03335 [Burkholderiales bacterium]